MNEKHVGSFFELAKHKIFKAVSEGMQEIVKEEVKGVSIALGNKDQRGESISAKLTGVVIVEDKDKEAVSKQISGALEKVKSAVNMKKAMENS